jgi:predicted N-acetyltransferase YhbS
MNVTIRKFRQGDKQKVFEFLQRLFAGWRTVQQWSWKFENVEEASGRKAAIWVVEDVGEIVGHLAFIPMKLRVGKQVFPVCQLVDGALDPRYRHGGVYRALVLRVLQDAEKEGNFATFGFANRPSYRIYERIGSLRTICIITKMFKVLSLRNAMKTIRVRFTIGHSRPSANSSLVRDLFPTLRKRAIPTVLDLLRNALASVFSCLSGYKHIIEPAFAIKAVEICELGSEFESMWSRLSGKYRYAFERDNSYLKWRYSNPETKYGVYVAERSGELVGYIAVAYEEKGMTIGKIKVDGLRVGYVMDLVAEEGSMIPLLSIAEKTLEEQGVCLMNCWTTGNSSSQDFFRRMQYYRLPEEIRRITLVASVHASRLDAVISSKQATDILIALGDADLV